MYCDFYEKSKFFDNIIIMLSKNTWFLSLGAIYKPWFGFHVYFKMVKFTFSLTTPWQSVLWKNIFGTTFRKYVKFITLLIRKLSIQLF